MEEALYLGLDAGSTTVKLALVDARGTLLEARYERHGAAVRIASTMGTCMMLIMLDPGFANSLFPNLAERNAALDQMIKDFIFAGLDDAAAKWRARPAADAARD